MSLAKPSKHTHKDGKEQRAGCSLVERDFRITRTVARLGVARATHVSTAEFWNKERWKPEAHKRCLARLKLLTDIGHLKSKKLAVRLGEGSKPFLYFLTAQGARALAESEGCDVTELEWRKVSTIAKDESYKHLLAINDVFVATEFAIRYLVPGGKLVRQADEVQLARVHREDRMDWRWPDKDGKEGREETNIALFPDGFVHFQTGTDPKEDWRLFLEVDRGTEPGKSSTKQRHSWASKTMQYLQYYKPNGHYQKRYDQARKGRVLTVVSASMKRLMNLKKITEEVGGRGRFWFALHDHLTPLTVFTEPIWQQAGKEGFYTFFDKETAYPEPFKGRK